MRNVVVAAVLVVCTPFALLGSRSVFGPRQAHAGSPRAVACDPGDLTLAIREANVAGGGTLSLAAGCTYAMNDPCLPADSGGRCEWEDLGFLMGPNALPAITSAITIEGNGAVLTHTSGLPFRYFVVAGPFTVAGKDDGQNDAPAAGALTLRNLTLRDGYVVGGRGGDGAAPGGGGAGLGGCIFAAGALTLDRVTLEGCGAFGGAPGNTAAYTGTPPNGGGGG
ncbi:MAG: hypothetical protein JST92_12175, partial [Deltaproteobacteria bacterium]|nr:hypothetical protein [Deltaproteobacteria bacterium]